MTRDRNELKAGLFIIVSIVAIIGILIAIHGGLHRGGPTTERQVSFKLTDDLGGLQRGDDVRLGGFKVGVVKSIDVVTADPTDGEPRLVVRFSLPSRYKLHGQSVVTVQSTITGVATLNIEKLGQGQEVAEVVGGPGALSALEASLKNAGPDLQAALHDVRSNTIPAATTLIRHVDAKIDPALDKYHQVADKAGTALTSVGDLFSDSKPDFRGTLANLNKVTANVRDRLPTLIDKLQAGLDKVNAVLDSARGSMEDVKAAVSNTRDITSSVRGLLVGNKGKFESIINSLKTTSDNLKGASIEVRRSPWRLLYKPTADEMGNLNLYDSTREFAEGAGDLDDAATALRDALHDKSTDSARVQKLLDRLDASFASFHEVENKLWSSVKQ